MELNDDIVFKTYEFVIRIIIFVTKYIYLNYSVGNLCMPRQFLIY